MVWGLLGGYGDYGEGAGYGDYRWGMAVMYLFIYVFISIRGGKLRLCFARLFNPPGLHLLTVHMHGRAPTCTLSPHLSAAQKPHSAPPLTNITIYRCTRIRKRRDASFSLLFFLIMF